MKKGALKSFWDKAVHYPWRQKFKDLIYNTPAEVYIGMTLVGALSGAVSFHVLSEQAKIFPVAFSEIEKTTREFANQNKNVPPLTRYYSIANDVPMKVFESSNIAHESNRKGTHIEFARELETRVDITLREYTLISEYAKTFHKDAQAALQSLDKIVKARKDIAAVNIEFDASWDEEHDDVTRLEHQKVGEDCDINGENCTDVYEWVSVYDHTDHTYTYHPEHGERGTRLLEAFLKTYPDLKINERLILAKYTGAYNEYAMEKSLERKLDAQIPSQEQARKYANIWATGSNFSKYMPVINSDLRALQKLAPLWTVAKNAIEDNKISYPTNSRFDSGPEVFQLAEQVSKYGHDLDRAIGRIVDGIHYADKNIPALHGKIKEYIGIVLDHKEGDADEVRKEIISLSQNIYEKNFEDGFDVTPFKTGMLALLTVAGMIAGGGVGYGVHRYLDKQKARYHNFKP